MPPDRTMSPETRSGIPEKPHLAYEKFIADIQVRQQNEKSLYNLFLRGIFIVVPLFALGLLLIAFQPRSHHAPVQSRQTLTLAPAVPPVTADPGSDSSQVSLPGEEHARDFAYAKLKKNQQSVDIPVRTFPDPLSRNARRGKNIPAKSKRADVTASKKAHRPKSSKTPDRTSSVKKEDAQPPEFDTVIDRTAFYVPSGVKVPRSKNNRKGFTIDRPTAVHSDPAEQDKIRLLAHLAQRHGGFFSSLIEHNGDYYKVKVYIPGRKIDPFKQALARKVEFASYKNLPEDDIKEKICLLIEFHSK